MKKQKLLSAKSLNNQLHQIEILSYDSKLRIIGRHDTTTLKLFGVLQNAYNYFREELYNGTLAPVILTLNRKAHSMGYYKSHAWLDEQEKNIPEININPAILRLEPIIVMQTLVHEMAHHYHFVIGKPGAGGYHNREFAHLMEMVGLICSDTGKPGGKKTGHRMSDYILPNGLFERKFYEMPEEYILPFKPINCGDFVSIIPSSPDKNKTKYICTKCNTSVWGKPNLNIICGDCKTKLITIKPAL